VRWGAAVLSFQEVSGLDNPALPSLRLPPPNEHGNVIMRKGVFRSGLKPWDWFNQLEMSPAKRSTITVSLLDESGTPTMVWTLANAWPTKLTAADLKAEGNEVAVETIEVTHEGLTVGKP
jgi:phage tail-like protein